MKLGDLQRAFCLAASELVVYAYSRGYEMTDGDAFRDPRVFGHMGEKNEGAYGRKNSLHKLKLARDYNLFKDGFYLDATEDHEPLGIWWEQTYAQFNASWGGRFNDGNHYSFMYRGFR